MKIIPISLPTPFPVGPVNVYLIAEDPVTLIDTGPKTREARDGLREALRRAGVLVSDIRRIVLTHTHEDHCGLARTLLKEAKNAEVLVHAWETGHQAARLQYAEHEQMLLRAGVPREQVARMQQLYKGVRVYSDSLVEGEYAELNDGEELQFASGALRVVHTPGHTPGSCSLVREADRTVIVGDTVLKRITPNPILSPDPVDKSRRFRSLEEYLVSLARLRSFAPTLLYCGHGEPIEDYEEIFNRYLRAIRERQAQIIELAPRTGATAWDIARELFPEANDIHSFLAVSETVAHLDLAHAEGKISVELADGGEREVYRKASSDEAVRARRSI